MSIVLVVFCRFFWFFLAVTEANERNKGRKKERPKDRKKERESETEGQKETKKGILTAI